MYKLLALLFAAAFFGSEPFGAPRAQSAEECGIAADMAIVAQSLAREEILPAAYTKSAPQKLAEELFAACMTSGGNMDKVLGQRS